MKIWISGLNSAIRIPCLRRAGAFRNLKKEGEKDEKSMVGSGGSRCSFAVDGDGAGSDRS
jgi:hypothetical protein